MDFNKRVGILIIGHGSRRKEANDALFQIRGLLKERLNIDEIEVAFFSLAKPTLSTTIDLLVKKGCLYILAQPFFLFRGNHTSLDLPHVLRDCERMHDGLKIDLLAPLGNDRRIVDILEERIIDSISPLRSIDTPIPASVIEATSMEIIEKRLIHYHIPREDLPIVRRVIHATADFSFVHTLRFHPEAVTIARDLLASGIPIIVDVNMVMAGIIDRENRRIFCAIGDQDVNESATKDGISRAEAAMEKLAYKMDRAIIVIGNAPTALRRVIEIVKRGDATPGVIIGVPVGFVDAQGSKMELMRLDLPYITNIGPRGGSPVGCAILNALISIGSN